MKSFLPIPLLLLTLPAWSETSVRGFDEIWDQLYQKSLKQKAVVLEKESHEESLKRADRHWLPRVYVSGQWFSTNDPTQLFFNQLGQRAI